MEKQYNFNLPLVMLLVFSVVLNYGQYSGWVKIENPDKVAVGYTQEQRDQITTSIYNGLEE